MSLVNLERIIIILVALLMSEALAFKPLDDQQLNAITAGSLATDYESSEALARIPLQYSHKNIEVEGDILVLPADTYNSTATLQLFDNAQSNLRSLININAVDSPINVLLNLNINVHSNIEKIIQQNLLLPD